MSRQKKYSTPAALRRACRRYISSISRTVPITEPYDTGRRDEYGHVIFEMREVKNDEGEIITYREFAVPPSITALCISGSRVRLGGATFPRAENGANAG